MFDFLQGIDEKLFYLINGNLANPLFDKFMPFITKEESWLIFYVLGWLLLVFSGGKKGVIAGILIIILVIITDQSSNLLKAYFHRIRPCNVLPGVHLLVNCTGSFSMPSSHAVNNFAAAVLLTHFYPRYKYVLFTGAFIVASSRIFVGVHYPFDMLVGTAWGILLSSILVYIWNFVNKKFKILKS
jgi:undecaprenyl-diphosphatase